MQRKNAAEYPTGFDIGYKLKTYVKLQAFLHDHVARKLSSRDSTSTVFQITLLIAMLVSNVSH